MCTLYLHRKGDKLKIRCICEVVLFTVTMEALGTL